MTEPTFPITVVTLFPDLVEQVSGFGVVGRAGREARYALETVDPRAFATDRHRRVDDAPFGGGPGMVLKPDVMCRAIGAARARAPAAPVIALGPRGRPLTQDLVRTLAAGPGLTLVCGRYEGFDERILEVAVDEEISLGDYVLSGGELPALVVLDAVVRLIPGALGNAASAVDESFAEPLVEHPQYTRPRDFEGRPVPAPLLSGDHAGIERWRRRESLGRTWLLRPDLVDEAALTAADRALLAEFMAGFRAERAARGLWYAKDGAG